VKADAVAKLAELRPYVEKLLTAAARGLDAEMVEQAGFQELFLLERGEPTTAVCPICYENVAANGPMVTTPCAHLFCRSCVLSWMAAQNVLQSDGQRMGAAATTKPCPCCRTPFSISSLVELTAELPAPAEAGGSATNETGVDAASAQGASSTGAGGVGGGVEGGGGGDGGGGGASSSADNGASSSADNGAAPSAPLSSSTAAAPPSSEPSGPTYCPAYTLRAFQQMAPPDGFAPVRVGRCPSVSPVLLGHLACATGLPPGSRPHRVDPLDAAVALSSRVRRLLADLEALGDDEAGVPRKAVRNVVYLYI